MLQTYLSLAQYSELSLKWTPGDHKKGHEFYGQKLAYNNLHTENAS